MTKVLVVDDDPALVKALRIGLTARGDKVTTTHSGADAISQVALLNPDLVILDLGLPDLDGIEVCRRIREFSHVPIVVLSAYGDEHRKVEALDGGADDFITKPFGMAELEARLRVAIRHAAPRRRMERPRPPSSGSASWRSTWCTTWRRCEGVRCPSPAASSISWPTWRAMPARCARIT